MTGLAALTLLSDVSESAPVLAVVDDAHWIDRSSLDVLAFVGARLDADRVVLLLSAEGHAPPAGFDHGVAELRLGPLPAADAGALLDRQPRPPRGRARSLVLAQAAGNPLALIELARVIAEDPAASRRWAAEPLPPGDRLTAAIAARFDALPASARAALLVAAVADGPDLRAAAGGVFERDAQALAPAERLGLVTIDKTGLRFGHPLDPLGDLSFGALLGARGRASTAGSGARRPARSAGAGTWRPRCCIPTSAWRRCSRRPRPRPQRRGGTAAAALAMERAAELSPDPEDQARRLISAASAAVTAGQGDWVQDLADAGGGGDVGPGGAAAGAQPGRVGAGLRGPPLGRVRDADLGRAGGGRRPPGSGLGGARGRGHRRLPGGHARPPPGRGPGPAPAGKPEIRLPRPDHGRRATAAYARRAVDTRLHRPVRQQPRAHRVPTADRRNPAGRGGPVANRLRRLAARRVRDRGPPAAGGHGPAFRHRAGRAPAAAG